MEEDTRLGVGHVGMGDREFYSSGVCMLTANSFEKCVTEHRSS